MHRQASQVRRSSKSRSPSPRKSPTRSQSSSPVASASAYNHVPAQLNQVRQEIAQARKTHNVKRRVNLVAVTKTHGPQAVRRAYEYGQRHFGENYVNELISKAKECPPDIRWHFIGHLQSNKCKQLVSIPNLHLVECVDSVKLAQRLNKACVDLKRPEPLNILIQVNTSGEESKSGIPPEECVSLAKYVKDECNQLAIRGLMTIGRYEPGPSGQFFKILNQCKDDILKQFPDLAQINAKMYFNENDPHMDQDDDCEDGGNDHQEFIMSMGMSHDYDVAIECGSSQLRVGTAIFGPRDYSALKTGKNINKPIPLPGETFDPRKFDEESSESVDGDDKKDGETSKDPK